MDFASFEPGAADERVQHGTLVRAKLDKFQRSMLSKRAYAARAGRSSSQPDGR